MKMKMKTKIVILNLILLLLLVNIAFTTTSEQIDNDAGLVDYYQGNYSGAIKLFKKAISKNQNFSEAYYNLGRTYMKLGKIELAVNGFENAVRINNNYKSAIMMLKKSKKLLNKKLKKGAKSGSKFKVKISPELSYQWDDFSEAFYCYYNDDLKDCKEKYTKMMSNHYNIRPFVEKGIIYYELKMYKEAISFFKKAYKIDSKNVHVLYDLGLAYEMNNNRDTAAWFYRRAIEVNPSFFRAAERLDSIQSNLTADYLAMAKRTYEKKEWQKSLDYLNKGLKFVRVNSRKYRQMIKFKKIVSARIKELKVEKENVKNTILNEKYTYDDVYLNGQIRYIDSQIIWNGVIEKIYEKNGETILQLFYISSLEDYNGDQDLIERPYSLIENGDLEQSTKKYFQVHCGKILEKNSRIAEDSTVEIYGKLVGLERMNGGYKFGISTLIPKINAYKLYITCKTCSGTLVIEK